MAVRIHPHAVQRMVERGATESEVIAAVESGERFAGKLGRTRFRRNFHVDDEWLGRRFATKQVQAYAELEDDNVTWLVITVIVRYYGEGKKPL